MTEPTKAAQPEGAPASTPAAPSVSGKTPAVPTSARMAASGDANYGKGAKIEEDLQHGLKMATNIKKSERKASDQVIVRTVDVKRYYKMGDETVMALKGVNLEIFAGEYISIMGPSGSGKSTFFNMVGGLDKPTSGRVFIDEVDIAQLTPNELAWLRCRKIGYIFQSYNIIPVMTALENVTLPMFFAGMTADEARDKGVALLKRVGLGERVYHTPNQLSGGQQQRVAIARALANSPAIVLADEPTGNLDLKTGEEIIQLLCELKDESGVTIIAATHDHKMLAASDRIVWIRDGLLDKVMKSSDLKISEGTIEGH